MRLVEKSILVKVGYFLFFDDGRMKSSLERLRESLAKRGFQLQRKADERPRGKSRKGALLYCPYCAKTEQPVLNSRSELLSHLSFLHHEAVGMDEKMFDQVKKGKRALAALRSFLRDEGVLKGKRPIIRTQGLEEEGDTSEDEGEGEVEMKELSEIRRLILPFIRSNPLPFFRIVQERELERSRRFRMKSTLFDLLLSPLGRGVVILALGLELMESLFLFLAKRTAGTGRLEKGEVKKPLYVSFSVDAPTQLSFPLTSPFVLLEENSVSQFMGDLGAVYSSNNSLFIDRQLNISVNCVGGDGWVGEGKGLRRRLFGGRSLRRSSFANEVEFVLAKRGVRCFPPVLFKSDCLAVCVTFGLLSNRDPGFLSSRSGRFPASCSRFKAELKAFCSRFPSINWNEQQDVQACHQVQRYLNQTHETQLLIYDGVKTDGFFFNGQPSRISERQRIHLTLVNEHLYYISRPGSFFRYECPRCLKYFRNEDTRQFHQNQCCTEEREESRRKCSACESKDCKSWKKNASGVRFCENCLTIFNSSSCYRRHLEIPPSAQHSLCDRRKTCMECGKKVSCYPVGSSNLELHECLIAQCYNCSARWSIGKGEEHHCIVQPGSIHELGISKQWARRNGIKYFDRTKGIVESRSSQVMSTSRVDDADFALLYPSIVGEYKLVIFDFESKVRAEDSKLEIFCASALFSCSKCCFVDYLNRDVWKADRVFDCCGIRQRDYYGSGALDSFIKDLFFPEQRGSTSTPVIAIAFYGSGERFLKIFQSFSPEDMEIKLFQVLTFSLCNQDWWRMGEIRALNLFYSHGHFVLGIARKL